MLNADDPLIADLGASRPGVVYFGVEDDSQALSEMQHAADSKHCRNCGATYDYAAIYLGHLGRYCCPRCGRERPEPDIAAKRVHRGMSGSRIELRTRRASSRSGCRSRGSTTSTTRWQPRPPR